MNIPLLAPGPLLLPRYRDQGGRDRTDLTVPASWELYVDMRFDQLRTACDLELWAEAFRSVEDIQVGRGGGGRWVVPLDAHPHCTH